MKRKLIFLGILLVLFVVAGLGIHYSGRKPHRPRYLFINETSRHEHDSALKLSLKMAESRSGIENALVLLPHLPPQSTIDKTASELFQKWGIGRDRGGKGLLYVYSEAENLFKIEVSYPLEGVFPDAVCRQLEEGAKTFMLSEIPQDFLSELLITMNLRASEPGQKMEVASSSPQWVKSKYLSGGAGAIAKGYRPSLNDYLSAVRSLSSDEVASYRPSESAEDTVRKYLSSIEKGLGDPNLPLLTEGSQVFRYLVPRTPAQQRRVSQFYQRAFPFRVLTKEGLGLVLFRPGVANLPIVLRRGSDKLWYVDEAKAWTFFHRFEDGTDFYPKFKDDEFSWALTFVSYPHAQEPVFADLVSAPKIRDFPFSLSEVLRRGEAQAENHPKDASVRAELAELYQFEMNWISKAIYWYEEAKKIDPQNVTYRWRLWDLYLNNSEPEKGLSELAFIADHTSKNSVAKRWLTFYSQQYAFSPNEF